MGRPMSANLAQFLKSQAGTPVPEGSKALEPVLRIWNRDLSKVCSHVCHRAHHEIELDMACTHLGCAMTPSFNCCNTQGKQPLLLLHLHTQTL